MGKECGVYCIQNKKNGKKYIGISYNIKRRFVRHKSELRNNKHENLHLQRSWNKHGENNFEFKILEELNKDIEILNQREIFYIRFMNTRHPNGYNSTDGGGGFYNPSEEVREKMRLRWLGEKNPNYVKNKKPKEKKIKVSLKRKPMSEETKEKIRISKTGVRQPNRKKPIGNSGDTHWTKFKSFSIESREKMSKTRKGKIHSQEHKRNQSIGMIGIKCVGSSSIYIGVSYRKDKNSWTSYIPKTLHNKKINVGTFKTEFEAARAYDEYCEKNNLFHRPLNFKKK